MINKLLLSLSLLLAACGSLPNIKPADANKAISAIEDVQSAVDRSDQDLRRLRAVLDVACEEPSRLPAEVCDDGRSSWNHLAADYETVVRPGLEKVKAVLRAVGSLAP